MGPKPDRTRHGRLAPSPLSSQPSTSNFYLTPFPIREVLCTTLRGKYGAALWHTENTGTQKTEIRNEDRGRYDGPFRESAPVSLLLRTGFGGGC
jgi:hypothetical protein